MTSLFRHVALIGKYQTVASGASGASSRQAMEDIAHFLHAQGCEVMFERDTAHNMGITGYPMLDVPGIGAQCDLALVVGGDGTMLGIGRQLAHLGVPLIGINQGRLGFITDIPYGNFAATLAPMLRGEYEEDHRSLMQARVMRDGHCVFDASLIPVLDSMIGAQVSKISCSLISFITFFYFVFLVCLKFTFQRLSNSRKIIR